MLYNFVLMKLKMLLTSVLLTYQVYLIAQQSNSITTKAYDTVTVTATRTQRILGNTAVPVSIISKATIAASGSVRLQDILNEQTGLVVTNNFGNGIQVQGLAPEYTLILVDGEPLIGRNGGVLDLSRFTVNNIKKIEIVKGPSSSLYGSEAMGGVINIITEGSTKKNAQASIRYGRYNTIDANINAGYTHNKLQLNASLNRYSTSGFDLNQLAVGKTQNPFANYTAQLSAKYALTPNTTIQYTPKLYTEKQAGTYALNNGDVIRSTVQLNEYTHTIKLQHRFNSKLTSQLRLYSSQYTANSLDVYTKNSTTYYDDRFKQNFIRAENQNDISLSQNHILTVGTGVAADRLFTNRYDGVKHNTQIFAYLQDDYTLKNKWNFITGVRYDYNSTYAANVSPKVALAYKHNNQWKYTASIGLGFKAPDFRQQFLNFTNNVAGGYTVYGANEISYATLQQQVTQGILSTLTSSASALATLKPETSIGYNVGVAYTSTNKQWSTSVQLFRNDLKNQIITKAIAFTQQGAAPVFSYFNVNEALTQGAEVELKYNITKQLQLSGGYQYLYTADKQVLRELKAGKIFGKDDGSLTARVLTVQDYGGQLNASKHQANAKVFFQNAKGLTASLRCLYRSRWGVQDVDGNLILHRNDEYTKSFTQMNITAGKAFNNGITLQLGADNITNNRNSRWLPNMPGITYYTVVKYNFVK